VGLFKRFEPVKAEIALNLENYTVADGEPFKGTTVLTASEDLHVDEVRIDVRITEESQSETKSTKGFSMEGSSYKSINYVFSQNIPVSQGFDIGKGESKEIPFEVNVRMWPATDGHIVYHLKAVANVKGRPDVTKEVNPTILPAARVRCQYCGASFELDPSVSKCPSCGAPVAH
jgi:predicted Zn-ribbon and HTH transcriptional regulator